MNILWVENRPRFERIAEKQFLPAYSVTVVPGLAVARQALSTGRFSVVLLDYDLDDGSGNDLVPEIKRLNPT